MSLQVIRGVLAGALLLLSATVARSELSEMPTMSAKFIIERIQAGDKDARYIYYLDGISTGLKYAKAKLQRDDRASLFCVHAMLTPEQEFDVLRSFVESHPATADLSLGNALLLALVDAFPCH